MKIQLVAPWHSMDEMPEFERQILIMCYSIGDNNLNCDWTWIVDSEDWETTLIKIPVFKGFRSNKKEACTGFAWCYLGDLAVMEFNRMVVKETAQDSPSVRYVGSGGSGYSRTGFGSAGGGGFSYVFMGGSGSGGSSHGSPAIGGNGGGMSPDGKAMCDLASSGVYPGWGVAGDLSQMRWPIGGIPGAYPQEKAEKEQD